MSSFMPRVTSVIFLAVISTATNASTFKLISPETPNSRFLQSQTLSSSYGFGCSGQNVSPEFRWSGAPKGTKSFSLNIFDKDAPTGMGWIQWQVINIPGSQTTLPSGFQKKNQNTGEGILETRTDYGIPGYAGPCPPLGQLHHYIVTLTALKIDKLPGVSENSTPAMIGYIVNANSLGKATLTITSRR